MIGKSDQISAKFSILNGPFIRFNCWAQFSTFFLLTKFSMIGAVGLQVSMAECVYAGGIVLHHFGSIWNSNVEWRCEIVGVHIIIN